ncbi:MAG: hypothetical protein ABSF35_09895 [Polyangia bacterium]|jgi:hypothetical protein
MATPDPDAEPETQGAGAPLHSLRQVRAAQLRARATRWAIGKSAFGTVFLIGALAYALGPDRQLPSSRLWMALLVVLSTFNVGLGLRTFSRVRRRARRFWLVATILWGLLATGLLRILLAR